jgi:hypothetical protein
MNKMEKEVIRRCPYCHQDMKIKKGLSWENVNKLFRKPTLEDFIMLFIILLTIVSFLAYTSEIKAYRRYINENCPLGQQQRDNEIPLNPSINASNLIANPDLISQLNMTNSSNGQGES